MITPAQPMAQCVLRWIYEQASAVLAALRALIENLIRIIDAQIATIKAFLSMIDPARILEEYVWTMVEAIINKIKEGIMSMIPGPAQELCPEFYQYFVDPAVAILENSLAVFSIYKDRYLKFISFVDFFNQYLVYWETTKALLSATLDVIDDAVYNILMVEAANAVP